MSKFSTLCKELVESAKRNQEVLSTYEYSIVDELKREGAALMRSVVNAETTIKVQQSQANSQRNNRNLQQVTRLTNSFRPTVDYSLPSTFMTYRLQAAGAGRIKRALMIYHNSRMTTLRRYILAYKELPKNYYNLPRPQRMISISHTSQPEVEMQNGSERPSSSKSMNGITDSPHSSTDTSGSVKRKVGEIDKDFSFSDENNASRVKRKHSNKPSVPVSVDPAEPYFSGQPTEYSVHLTPAEIRFGKGYMDLQKRISSKFPMIDLFGTHLPPKETLIHVRASRDIKNVPTFEGVINICEGSQVHVKRDDVIKLLTDGALKPVEE